ncbi:MAG: hypothetical protein RIQ33_1844 [Bacteroidota bacterium]|jgi:hypothetical protein
MGFFDYTIKKVWFTDSEICIETTNGKTASLPLQNFKSLSNALPTERNNFEIVSGGYALHWQTLDEDISADGFFNKE